VDYYLRFKSLSHSAREYQCVDLASLKGPVTQHSLQRFARAAAMHWGQCNGSTSVEVTLEDDQDDIWKASILIPNITPATLGEAASIEGVSIEVLCRDAIYRLLDDDRLTVAEVVSLARASKECVQ
jgi:hypothetical protein